MYIERDSRRQTPRETKTDSAESFEYLNRCLDLLINYISDTSPKIVSEFSSLRLKIKKKCLYFIKKQNLYMVNRGNYCIILQREYGNSKEVTQNLKSFSWPEHAVAALV